jgi:hypothetical protein
MRRLLLPVAWAALAFIAYATLARNTLVYWLYGILAPLLAHPSMHLYVPVEHLVAFAVLGALFSIVYPRHTLLVLLFVLAVAGLLEALQTLTPDRHGTLIDYLEKTAGGAIGIGFGKLVEPLFRP